MKFAGFISEGEYSQQQEWYYPPRLETIIIIFFTGDRQYG